MVTLVLVFLPNLKSFKGMEVLIEILTENMCIIKSSINIHLARLLLKTLCMIEELLGETLLQLWLFQLVSYTKFTVLNRYVTWSCIVREIKTRINDAIVKIWKFKGKFFNHKFYLFKEKKRGWYEKVTGHGWRWLKKINYWNVELESMGYCFKIILYHIDELSDHDNMIEES